MTTQRPILFGKYQLISQIARGGMAEVWKAKAHGVEGFEKVLVIKRILPELSENPRFVEMFINEAKIAVTLSHANIVQVFDLGQANGSYFIAMEYVAGMDLAALLRRLTRRGQRLAPELALYLVSELAKGLDYAHRRRDAEGKPLNIVHRDVSPQNVVISGEGEVKLTDFGIAKARHRARAVTELGVVKGKYAYMAPEQLMGAQVDARADVFAAGILLYQCLTGENPFQADSTYETLKRIRSADVAPLQDLAPDVDPEVVSIVDRALAFEPDQRYSAAGELYEDLIQYLYGRGKRVGARALSELLKSVMQSAEQAGVGADGLKRAFNSDFAATSDAAAAIAARGAPALSSTGEDSTRVGRRPLREHTGAPAPTPKRERAERRAVTAAVFAMGQDERLSADTVTAAVARFGGTVCEGPDGPAGPRSRRIVALFGDQVPDGRDSDNAARCALRVTRAASMTAAEGNGTTLGTGACAGHVLVDLEGGVVRDAEYQRLLSHAAEMAAAAADGEVVVDADTEQELRSRFRLAPATTVDAHRNWHVLTHERSQHDGYGRFIGRRDALRQVGTLLSVANRGQAQVIGVRGEAGSGKSRLLSEILRRLQLTGHSAAMHVATLNPHMRDVPLSAIQEMVRVFLGVDEFDPETVLKDRVGRLRELGLVETEQRAVAAILGLGDNADEEQNDLSPLHAALSRITKSFAEDQLTIIAWDGADYIDGQSAAVIQGVARSLANGGTRVAAIATFHPEHYPAFTELSEYTEITLSPLGDDEIARLTAARLGADEIPFELLREVSTKSGGNPLYVEEYLKALQESGAVDFEDGQVTYEPDVAHVKVPKSLRGIIASRVARLDAGTRYLLQVAALSGERFQPLVVASAAQEPLQAVESALAAPALGGIIADHGAKERAFAHRLVRQVVQESVTLKARREMHRALAEALEQHYPDRRDELAERLARHYEAAGVPFRAVEYLELAAQRLEEESALESAAAMLEEAIDLLSDTPNGDQARTFELYERVARLSFQSRRLNDGAQVMGRAIKRAEVAKSPSWQARFCMWRGRLLSAASRTEDGRHWLEQAQHLAHGLTDGLLSRDVFVALADVDARRGEFERAVGYLKEALKLSERLDEAARIGCLSPLALMYARMGDHAAALATYGEARALAEVLGEPATHCRLWRLLSQVHYHARDQKQSAVAAARAVEVAREANLSYFAALNAHHMGECYLRLDDHRRAFAALRSSYEVAVERGYTRLQMTNLRALGYIDAVRFGSAEGHSRVARAVAYAEAHDFVWDIIQGKYFLAGVEQVRGDTDAARALLREVLELAVEHGHRKYTEDAEAGLRQLEAGQPIGLPL